MPQVLLAKCSVILSFVRCTRALPLPFTLRRRPIGDSLLLRIRRWLSSMSRLVVFARVLFATALVELSGASGIHARPKGDVRAGSRLLSFGRFTVEPVFVAITATLTLR